MIENQAVRTIMEVLVGPTFPAYVKDRAGAPAQDKHEGLGSCLFLEEEGGGETRKAVVGSGFETGVSEDWSESSSSIGAPGDSDGEDGGDEEISSKSDGNEDEVQSKLKGGLGSLDSLEESLPIKRGLSNHYSGKSKSFANLLDVNTLKDMEKPENPFNKRRRVLLACKLSRKSSFYSWKNPTSMPLLALNEEEDQEEEQEKEEKQQERVPKVLERKLMSFKSQSCFSLSDLQDEHA